ncbi:hypothetical protein [Burkholderia ubonensis]|uniref:hypothetical protein n=1 Tax=Burkholderia ubonensis TaxID=101571 RepID=UPI000A987B72|nr:hypothetical protein [Burkholderia ubonensis]
MNDFVVSPEENARATWSYLAHFRVELGAPTGRVFRNFRQWVPIDVVLEAREANGNVVQLTRAELEGIRLIKYVGSAELPLTGSSGWVASYVNPYPQYEPYPTSQVPLASDEIDGDRLLDPEKSPGDLALFENEQKRIAVEQERHDIAVRYGIFLTSIHHNSDETVDLFDAPSEDNSDIGIARQPSAQSIRFYVRTTDTTSLRIAAKIPRPGGGYIMTNSTNPGGGEFDSSVTITTEAPRRYTANSFSWNRVDEFSNSYWDIDLYYIYLNNGLKIVDVKLENMWEGHRNCYYRWRKSGHFKTQWAFGAGAPFNFTITRGNGQNATVKINQYFQSEGKATAFRASCLGCVGDVSRTACARAHYYDQYGNEHSVWIAHSSDGNTIYVSDTNVG